MTRAKTSDLAKGKWRGILLTLGVGDQFLTGKHAPCPVCGGRDRFRFDNRDGSGSFICSQCGGGTGFKLLELVKGWDFRTAAAEVDRIIGRVEVEPVKPGLDPERRKKMLNGLWKGGETITPGDPVQRYLEGRGLDLPQNRDCLRFVASCPVPDEVGARPAMVAMVSGPDGKPVTLHRTFLGPNGKADMPEPRALMPGQVPDGAAVRLSMHGDRLGIAEGIETALAASKRFGLPVWAAINSTMMVKWLPPEGVKQIVVFGDNDPKFGGAAAAYVLAHRLAARLHLDVEVRIPERTGCDWADRDAA